MNSKVSVLLWTRSSDGMVKSASASRLSERPFGPGVGWMVAKRVPFIISSMWLNWGRRLGENA